MIAITRTAFLLLAWTLADAKADSSRSEMLDRRVGVAPPTVSSGVQERTTQREQSRIYVSARRLIGSAVLGPDDTRIGTVRDVLFSDDGRASAVIMSSSRWLRGLPRYYRASWSTLEFASGTMGVNSAVAAADLRPYPWSARRQTVRENETRARVVLRSKVLLENRTRYGNVRDILFDRRGNMQGLVIVPLAKLGDARGDREPHIYSGEFSVDALRRRITLPHGDKGGVRADAG